MKLMVKNSPLSGEKFPIQLASSEEALFASLYIPTLNSFVFPQLSHTITKFLYSVELFGMQTIDPYCSPSLHKPFPHHSHFVDGFFSVIHFAAFECAASEIFNNGLGRGITASFIFFLKNLNIIIYTPSLNLRGHVE